MRRRLATAVAQQVEFERDAAEMATLRRREAAGSVAHEREGALKQAKGGAKIGVGHRGWKARRAQRRGGRASSVLRWPLGRRTVGNGCGFVMVGARAILYRRGAFNSSLR